MRQKLQIKDHKLDILLVDDNPDDVLLIQEMLKEVRDPKINLENADRLSSGLNILTDDNIDVVLLDLSLPDSHGLETIIRILDCREEIPIIVLTGLDDEEMGRNAVQTGAQDYLVKDEVNGNILLRAIRYAIERNEIKKDLLASENRLRRLVEKNADAIIVTDKKSKVLYVNPAAITLFDRKKKAFIGELFGYPVVSGDIVEIDIISKGSKTAAAEMHVVESEWEGESAYLISLRNITQRKILEGQLVQAQKLESIGQLAAGIAHEINTPTQYVGDNTRFLQESIADLQKVLEEFKSLLSSVEDGSVTTEKIAKVKTVMEDVDLDYLLDEIPISIEQSLEGIDRVAHIVRAMKEFSHPGSKEKIPVDINKAIETTITVSRNEWKYVAEMETDFHIELPMVPCLPGEFNQVILNMITNAAHAIGTIVGDGSNGKGVIKIVTSCNGGWAEIRISDTGTGIPEANKDKIFNPFFTTKEVGKGTGQGLAIAHNVIVERHGGQIIFETEESKGTTFIIRLPIDSENVTKKRV